MTESQEKAQPIPISATIDMDVAPEVVWAVLSDVLRMPEFSPELQKVIPIGTRTGLGQRLIGINRRKWLFWPTTSKVVRWEPGRAVAWHTRESGATWVYEIEPLDDSSGGTTGATTGATTGGSRVTARRELPGFTVASKLTTPLMGGAINHDHELAAGLRLTLERIKAAVER